MLSEGKQMAILLTVLDFCHCIGPCRAGALKSRPVSTILDCYVRSLRSLFITETLPYIYGKFMTSLPRRDYAPRTMKG